MIREFLIYHNFRHHMITGEPVTQKSGSQLLHFVPRQDWEFKHEQVHFLMKGWSEIGIFKIYESVKLVLQIKLDELLGEGALTAVYKATLTDKGREILVLLNIALQPSVLRWVVLLEFFREELVKGSDSKHSLFGEFWCAPINFLT